MEECLVNILPELQERIFNFCERTDLINLLVACTNSSNHHSVADIIKETLWKSVTIPTRVLRKGKLSSSSSNKKTLKNLRCTQILHIHGGGCEEGISDLNNNRVTDAHVKEFSKVLEYCEPLVLLSVCIAGSLVNDANLTALMNRTSRLKKLELIGSAGATSISLQLHILKYQFLEELTLCGCGVVDDDLAHIASSLTNLKVLDIPCTLVTDHGLQHLFMSQCLTKLNVSECRGVSDAGLHHLPVHIEKLYMFNCNITDQGVLLLTKNLTALHSVDVASTRVTDRGLAHLSRLDLKQLDISGCSHVTSVGILHVCKISTLSTLHLYELICVGDDELLYICEALPSLRCLDIGCTSVTDHGLRNLNKLSMLEELDISSSKDRGCSITTLGVHIVLLDIPSLRKLEMGDLCCVTDVAFVIRGRSKLSELSVNGCTSLTDEAMFQISKVTTLKKIDISATDITDTGLRYLSDVKSLQSLNCRVCPNISKNGLIQISRYIKLKSDR